jgi:hypothetical protein
MSSKVKGTTHCRVRPSTIEKVEAWIRRAVDAQDRAGYRPWWTTEGGPSLSEAIEELIRRVDAHKERSAKAQARRRRKLPAVKPEAFWDQHECTGVE